MPSSEAPAPAPIDHASMFALIQAFDTDGDGFVSSHDFKQGLSSIGFQISAADADTLCRALDTDGSGNIRIDSLAELLEPPQDAAPPAGPDVSDHAGGSMAMGGNVYAAPGTYAAAAPADVGGDGSVELAAWEALAARDPAAAAEAIAALPDGQAEALYAALAGRAAAQMAEASPAPAALPEFADAEALETDDSAALAAARSAHRAMMMSTPVTGAAGSLDAALEAPPPNALPAAPTQPPPQPPQPASSAAAPSQPQPPPLDMHASVGSLDLPDGLSSSRPTSTMSQGGRRRSFGSLATRFSLRSPGATPSSGGAPPGSLLSATLLAQQQQSLGTFPMPTTPTPYEGMSLASGPQSVAGGAASERDSVPPRPASRAGSLAQNSRLGSRSSLSVSFEKRESLYRPQDIATLPQKLGELLLANHARAIDLFRAMDPKGEGTISRDAFTKALRALGMLGNGERNASPTGRRRSKSPTSGRDYEREIDELFATFDVGGDGSLDYEELHRLLRVGQNSKMSEYLRAAVGGKSLPPQTLPFSGSYTGVVAKPKPSPARPRDPAARSGPGMALAEDRMNEIREDAWPPQLRGLLLRERERVIDLFRHWEGVGEGGRISAEHFKAGLFVLGHRVGRHDVQAMYDAMGVEPGGMLRFAELRRQLRVVSHRGNSAYLRAATKQGLELEATQPRGSLQSGVGERLESTPAPTPQENILAALGLASTTHQQPRPTSPVAGAGGVSNAGSLSRASSRGGLLGGMSCSSHYSDGVVGLGADASATKERALAAAHEAAVQGADKSTSLLASEMWLQQWARSHYSVLLPELRKWELYPDGMITFDVFADSLHTLGFPGAGRWQEVESVFYSWLPDEAGRLHWQTCRGRMTGGRMVRVHGAKRTTQDYYKQASRAGEGFGNRSASRFRYETSSFVGPGKYTPDSSKTKSTSYTGGAHSGKLKSTAPRFLKTATSDSPGPGKYTPRHTLIDARNEIPPA